jgi:carbon monoxide dehydrogenase subunit G
VTRRARIGCGIAAAIAVLLVATFGIGMALQAEAWSVTRTRVISASPERVHEVLSDVRSFAACCAPRDARAPSAALSFSPVTRGAGAWVEWTAFGERERATIGSDEPTRVVMQYLVGGRMSRQTVEWRSASGGTEVTWTVEGDKSGLMQRLFWPFVGLDGRVGASIDESLAALERFAC